LHLASLLVDLQLDCFKHYTPEMLAAAARLLRFEVSAQHSTALFRCDDDD
jgi:hypothetical protein